MTIRLGEYFFKPKVVTVHVGQAVRFVNVGKIEHTVADTDAKGTIRSRLIKPRPLSHGQVQTVRFKRAGLIRYLCTFHPTLMKGRITVVR
jgi:plastocyanin